VVEKKELHLLVHLEIIRWSIGIGSAIAAPFLMGGDEEEIDEGTPFTMAYSQ
jgi:hypothetical protein